MRLPAASFVSLLLLGACGNAPPPPAEEAARPAAAPGASWSSPESPEWEVAARKVKGSKSAECDAVHAAVQAEQACKGSLCAHAVKLAGEWAKHCNEGPPRGDDEALVTELTARAKKPPSECGARAEVVLAKGCERDATCEVTTSKWAAKCAKSDGSPLVLALLGRVVAQKSALSQYKIDTRTCDELRADVKRGVACEKAACPAAFKDAQAYRVRCSGEGGTPDAAWAMVEAAIFAAAGQPTVPALVKPDPPKLTPADMPVPLADRWGAVAAVCDERPADVGRYVAARRACEKGKIVFVRVFVNPGKEYDVRAGTLPVPDDETFARRFPSLRVLGELEARDEAARQALLVELPKVVALAKDPSKAPEAAAALVKITSEHGASLERSAAVRAAFVGIDGDLAPALAEIGRAKLAAAKNKPSAVDLAGLAARAPTRPFADLDDKGAVAIGAPGAASRLDGPAFLPRAMKAYTSALDDLAKLAKKRPLPPREVREAKARVAEASKSCVAAGKRAQGAERDLVACAFTMNTCEPVKVEALTRALDDDRNAMIAARHTLDLAKSLLPAAARDAVEDTCPAP